MTTKKTVSMKENLDPNYRNDITKQDNSRSPEVAEDRGERPIDRSEEVVEIDGQKFIRTIERSLRDDNPNLKLDSKPGFYRRWVSAYMPGRLQKMVNLGFRHATTLSGKLIKPVERTTQTGLKEKLIPMEIPVEMREQFERAENLKAEALDKQVDSKFAGQNLGANNSQTYVISDNQQKIK